MLDEKRKYYLLNRSRLRREALDLAESLEYSGRHEALPRALRNYVIHGSPRFDDRDSKAPEVVRWGESSSLLYYTFSS
jgi:hypothetical protein